MLSHLDLNSRCMKAVNIIRARQLGSEPAGIKAVFVRLSKQTHGYTARNCPEQCITNSDIREAIHRQVDLLILLVNLRNRARAVILCRVLIGQQVYRWINWKSRVPASQRRGNVGVVSIKTGVCPYVVVPGLETVNYGRII